MSQEEAATKRKRGAARSTEQKLVEMRDQALSTVSKLRKRVAAAHAAHEDLRGQLARAENELARFDALLPPAEGDDVRSEESQAAQ